MVDAVRAALRLLPVARPGGRVARTHPQSQPQSQAQARTEALLGTLTSQPQASSCERQAVIRVSGLLRFARAFLSYVGVGISAAAASHLLSPSVVHAREICSIPENFYSMAAPQAVWQRGSGSRQQLRAQEDFLRSSKAAFSVTKPSVDGAGQGLGSNYWLALDEIYSKTDMEWPVQSASKCLQSEDVEAGSGLLACDENAKAGDYSPGNGYGFCSTKSTGSCFGLASECGDTTELERGWQLVVDPYPKGKPVLEGTAGASLDLTPEVDEEGDGVTEESRQFSGSAAGSCAHDAVKVQGSGAVAAGAAPLKAGSVKCGDRGGPQDASRVRSLSWRTAGKDELAALVAQKAGGFLENCDLPTPLSTRRIINMSLLEACDLGTKVDVDKGMSRFIDGKLLASCVRGQEPTRLDNLELPPSPLRLSTSDPTSASPRFATASQPLSRPSLRAPSAARHKSLNITRSADNRNTSWHGGGANISAITEAGLLGQALCHSQTRAREAEKAAREAEAAAEKAAEKASREKEQLVRMFFREASLSLTYRHWVSVLEAEKFFLGICARDRSIWLQQNIFRALEQPWRNLRNESANRQMQHRFTGVWPYRDSWSTVGGSHVMMSCTLGLAFALGLSLAGAGLMLGWSMGWILLAY